MMNKLNVKQVFIAVVLVGATMLFIPVQTGVMGAFSKFAGDRFEDVKIVLQGGLVVGGSVLTGFAYTANAEKIISLLGNKADAPEGIVKTIISFLLGKEDAQEIKKVQDLIDTFRIPIITVGCSVAGLSFILFLRNVLKDDNKKHNKSENLKHVDVPKVLETYPKVGG